MLEQIITITGVARREWQPFSVTSPGGIPFAGYLCRQESEKLGMLAVTELAGEERLEFIPAMPKIHYPYHQEKDGSVRVAIPVAQNVSDARFNVKLDGTAVIFYPLADKQGNLLEVLPRTRLQPVLQASRWGDWHALLAEVLPDQKPVAEAIRAQKVVLVFELWGYRNPHLVKYDTPLKLTLHTAVAHRKPVSYRKLADIANRYGFDLIPTLEVARPDPDGLAQAYRRLQAQMEAHNQAAGPEVFVEEGAILMLSTRDTAEYYKCLDGRSLVLTRHGWKRISSIVVNRLEIEVATLEPDGCYGWRRITDWFRNPIGERRMIRISLKHARKCSNGLKGINVTTDHLFLTRAGYKTAGNLTTDDWVVTGEIAPNLRQMELLDGMMLGDASIQRERNTRIRFLHADHEYAQLKEKSLGSLVSSSRIQTRAGKYNYNPGSRNTYEVDLKALIWTRQQKERWYPHGKKQVPPDLVLSDLTLAAWYLDDGGLTDRHAIFATNAFEQADVERLSDLLKAEGMENQVTGQNTIRLNNKATRVLMARIGAYIPPCMRRKALNDSAPFDEERWQLGEPVPGYDTPVFGKASTPDYERTVYCIGVDQTENFVTAAGIVHNCKPPTIEEIHWTADANVGKTDIEHALHKMLENGYDFGDGRVADLHTELEADFDPPRVEMAADLIERVYREFVLELQQREWLRHLVAESGLDPHDTPALMRYLSQHYPKNQMRWVFTAVKTLYGE